MRKMVEWVGPAAGGLLVFGTYRFYYELAGIHQFQVHAAKLSWIPAGSIEDMVARLQWGMATVLLTLAWLAALGVILRAVWRCLRGWGRWRRGLYLGGCVILAALGLAVGLAGNPLTIPAGLRLIDHGFQAMAVPEGMTLLYLATGMGISVGVLLIGGATACLAHAPDPSTSAPARLATQTRYLNQILYAGAAFLVAAVLQTGANHELPLALLQEPEPLAPLVKAITVATGTLWTLFLFAIYLPAALTLRARAQQLAREAVPSHQEKQSWLQNKGLAWSPLQQLTRVGAVLSPFIAGGPLMTVIQVLGG